MRQRRAEKTCVVCKTSGDINEGSALTTGGGLWFRAHKENGEALADFAVPAQAVLHSDHGHLQCNCSERPSVGRGRARDNEPARILQDFLTL
jgi:hypothetical protein